MMNLPKTTFSFIFYFLRQQWLKFLILMLASVIWAFNDSFFPFFLKRIVNTLHHYNGPNVYSALSGVLILLVLFWLMTEVLTRLQGILSIYTFPKFRASIRESVFDYVKSHSHEYFSNHFAGSIAKKLGDLPTSSQTMMEIICYQFVTAVTGIIIISTMMWSIKPIFALILLIWLTVHLSIAFIFLRFSNYLWEIHSDAATTLSGKMIDAFTNVLNLRLFARGSYEVKYLKQFQDDEIKKAQKAMWTIEIMLGKN